MSSATPQVNEQTSWQRIKLDQLDDSFWQAWDTLQCTSSSNFFTSSSWTRNWLKIFWQPHWRLELHIAVQDGHIRAILPFYSQAKRNPGATLLLLGQGEPESSGVASEYLDILCTPLLQETCKQWLRQWAREQRFGSVYVRAIHQDALLFQALGPWLKQADVIFSTRYQNKKVANDTWAGFSKNTRNRYKRFLNQCKKQNAQLRWLEPCELSSAWKTLKYMHQVRWQGKGKSGAFNSQQFENFHLELLKCLPENCQMSGLFVNGKAIALNYYYVSDGCLHFYQSGWDSEQAQHLSPGLNLHVWSIQNSQLSHYDFMMGGEQSYKSKMSNKKAPMLSLTVALNWKARSIFKLKKLKRSLLAYLKTR